MAFVNDFLKSLAMPIGDLAKWLEEEHQIPVHITIGKWNEITGMQVVIDDDDNSATCEEVEDQTINIGKKNNTTKNTNMCLVSNTCQHVFIAGNRKGQQCTTKPKGGNDRCSAHKLKVKKSPEIEKKQIKTKKRPIKKVKSKEVVKTDSESEISDNEEPQIAGPSTRSEKKIPASDSESEIFNSDNEEEPQIAGPSTRSEKKIPAFDSESECKDENSTSKRKTLRKRNDSD